MSYGELLQAGLRVASAIRRRLSSRPPLAASHEGEVRLHNVVCVTCERSVELIVAMMAIQLAGAVYCPVHPQLPAKRKAELYTQTECAIVLCTTRTAADVAQAVDACDTTVDVAILRVDDTLSEERKAGDKEEDERALDEETLKDLNRAAYAIFTSGTTGKPKAAVIPHLALATPRARSIFEALGVHASTRRHDADVAEVTFDPSIMWEVYSRAGHRRCDRCPCCKPGGLLDPANTWLDTVRARTT